jgi:hypothetical protein
MICPKRLATAMIASLAITACSDMTAPRHETTAANHSDAGSVTEVSFIKWFTTAPTMTGNTSLGAGTFAGTITKRIVFDNSVIVQLGAIYQVKDPSGDHSFTAVIEGMENLQTASAVLNGVVTAGWRVGAQVHVSFDIIRPCALATGPSAVGTCFQGTIRIQG